MQKLSGYQNLKKIYESSKSEIYRAFDEKTEQQVILKRLNKGYPTPEEVSKFNREYEITSMFRDEGVIQVLGLTKIGNSSTIIMEDIGGQSLSDIIKFRKL